MTGLATALASLPMYDAPRDALAAFWTGVRSHLAAAGVGGAPLRLAEPTDLDAHWRSPDLLLSQTCGLPLSTTLRDAVVPLGTPHYDAPGCDGPLYRSLVVVRGADPAHTVAALRDRRAAINCLNSHSGCSQLFGLVPTHEREGGFFAEIVISGSHRGSLELVRSGRADAAAIDCVTFALAARDRPEAVSGLKVIERSAAAPGLPFVASVRLGPVVVEKLRGALSAAIRDPGLRDVRAALMISGISTLPLEAYDVCRRSALSVPRRAFPKQAAATAEPAARATPC